MLLSSTVVEHCRNVDQDIQALSRGVNLSVRVKLLIVATIGLVLSIVPVPSARVVAQSGTLGIATPLAEVSDESVTNQWYVNDTLVPFSDLGYNDQTVTSRQAMIDYELPLPPGMFPVDYTGLVLNISHSPLLLPDASTMTVFANGTAITSLFLDESNQAGSSIEIELPVAESGIETYLIQIVFSMSISGESCEPDDNQALWATVHDDSTFYSTRRHNEGTADLATLDRQFVNLANPISIVMPAVPTAAEIEAAGLIAFQLGRWNANDPDFPALVYASAANGPIAGPAIYVGTGAGLADQRNWSGLSWNGSGYVAFGGAVVAESGVVSLIQDPNPILLVSGTTDLALLRAANALTNDVASGRFQGPIAIVNGEDVLEGASPGVWSAAETSFEELGFAERVVRGEGSRMIDFTFRRPTEWIAGNGGYLSLDLVTSPAIASELSWMSVSVNGMEIGTATLSGSEEPTSYRFDLPAEAINGHPGGQLDVQIQLHMQLPTSECQLADPMSAWVQILPESRWSIPHAEYPDLELARLPAPFATESGSGPFLIVMPDAATATDIDAGLHVAAAFGQRSDMVASNVPQLIAAGGVSDELRGARSMVVVGSGDTNSVAAQIERQSVLPAIVSETAVDQRVEVSLIPSPWFGDGAVLSVVPGSAERMDAVTGLFSDPTTLAALSGTSAIVDPNLLPETTGLAVAAIQPPDATPLAANVAPEVTRAPTEFIESAVIESSTQSPRFRDDDITEGWKLAAALLIGGFFLSIVSFLWIRHELAKREQD